MAEKHVNIPIGHLDQDSDNRYIDPKNYRRLLNMRRRTTSSNTHLMKPLNGNVEVPFDLPVGDNLTIGRFEDKKNRSVIFFNWNSNGDHGIYQFFIETSTVVKVIEYDFKWEESTKITGVDLVNGELLYWTDNIQPRKINIEKAKTEAKKKCWNVYFPLDAKYDSGLFSLFTLTLRDQAGVEIFKASTIIYNVPERNEFVERVADKIKTTWPNEFTAEACDGFLKLCENNINGWFLEMEIGPSNSAVKFLLKIVPENWYGYSLIDRFFDLYKWQPPCDPKASYSIDEDFNQNFVKKRNWQFAVQYIYDDNEKSKLGPISCIPLNNIVCGEEDQEIYNCIDIQLNDEANLYDERTWAILDRINILAREGNEGVWRIVDTVGHQDIFNQASPYFVYRFYNNTITYPIDTILSGALNDRLPRACEALKFIENKLVLGGNKDGYNVPDCVRGSVTVTPTQSKNDKLYTISGRVRIGNWQNSGAAVSEPGAWTNVEKNRIGVILQHNEEDEEGRGQFPVYGGIPSQSALNGIKEQGTLYDQWIPLGGFLVYAAGTEHVTIAKQIGIGSVGQKSNGVVEASDGIVDIENVLEDGDVYSEFEMKVKPGTYIIRVASPWCSFNDVLSKGGLYDLNNGTGYQMTSANVKGVHRFVNNAYVAPQHFIFEIVVTVTTSDVFIGDFIVEDMSDIRGTSGFIKAIGGYLLDTEGDLNKLNFEKNCTFVERQSIDVIFEDSTKTTFVRTDHNGHFNFKIFGSLTGNIEMIPRSKVLSTLYALRIYESANESVLRTINNNKAINTTFMADNFKELLLIYETEDFSQKHKAKMIGNVIGAVSGEVLFTGTGRRARIDSLGDWSMIIYADGYTGDSRVDNLIFGDFYGCPTKFAQNNILTIIGPIGKNLNTTGLPYSQTSPFDAGILQTISAFDGIIRSLKRGGRYKAGIRYKDAQGRVTSVVDIKEFIVPHYYESTVFGETVVTIDIEANCIDEAHHYDLMISENLHQHNYIQWVVDSIRYLAKYDFDSQLETETNYNSGSASLIALGMNSIVDSFQRNRETNVNYEFAKGDIVTLLINSDGEYYDNRYEFEVVEFNVNNELIVKNLSNAPQIQSGAVVEVYTPKALSDNLRYFEFGECYPCTAPDTANNKHSATSIQLQCGDTFNRKRTMRVLDEDNDQISVFQYILEANTTSDNFGLVVADHGRIGFEDPDYKELFRPTSLRVSDSYKADTEINGLSSYEDVVDKELDRQYGEIKSIVAPGNVLMVILTNRAVSIYVNENILSSQANLNELLIKSEVFLDSDRALLGDYGTQHPESVYEKDGRVTVYDHYKGVFWRYSRDGITVISDYNIKSTAQAISASQLISVISVYDEYHNEVLFTTIGDVNKTLSFDEKEDGWVGEYSFLPEMYAATKNLVIAFKAGRLYIQEANPVKNNFFGVQYFSEIEVVVNTYPEAPKVYLNMSVESESDNWEAYDINNDLGQQSSILSFKRKETHLHAAYLRDINTPNKVDPILNGTSLRSTTLNINLRNTGTVDFFLRAINTFFNVSKKV